jgi:predicted O-methyltransferase YrrM
MGRMDQWHSQETAKAWDSGESDQLPTRAEQEQILLALLSATPIGDGSVLDLGVGSGLVAETVLDRLPDARLVGIDSSEAMLELARRRLERFGSRATILRGDLSELDRLELPRTLYSAAFSVQTMHHLSGRDWADAARWTAELVEPGGLIVIVDRVQIAESLFRDWIMSRSGRVGRPRCLDERMMISAKTPCTNAASQGSASTRWRATSAHARNEHRTHDPEDLTASAGRARLRRRCPLKSYALSAVHPAREKCSSRPARHRLPRWRRT